MYTFTFYQNYNLVLFLSKIEQNKEDAMKNLEKKCIQKSS